MLLVSSKTILWTEIKNTSVLKSNKSEKTNYNNKLDLSLLFRIFETLWWE